MKESLSVCIPVYNGASTILQTIHSVLAQTFRDFELVIVDNASTDSTVNLVKSVSDKRIKLYINDKNLGCGRNLEECKKKAAGDIIFYICSDDVADINALEKVYNVFKASEDIGAVIRPYYWFQENILKPVRATRQFSENRIISIDDSYDRIMLVLALSDQISGVAFRKKYINSCFGYEPFVEIANLAASMLKNSRVGILKDNIVAIRISNNGSMNPDVYKRSPLMAWRDLVATVYPEDKFIDLRKYLIRNFIAKNYIGLVQIKNFGSYKFLFREIYYLVKLRWQNILDLQFWFFSILTIVIPRFLLKKMVVICKNKFNSEFLKNIEPIKLGG